MNVDLHRQSLEAIHDDPDALGWDTAVRRHVEECEACQKTRRALYALLTRLKPRAEVRAPEHLVAKIRAQTRALVNTDDAVPRSPAPRRDRLRTLGAVAAGLVLGLLLAPLAQNLFGEDNHAIRSGEIRRTVVHYLEDVNHDRHLLDRTGRPLEHVTADPGDASTWLSQGLGFPVALGATPQDWTLDGARVWHTVSRLSALAVYDSDRGAVSVFAVPVEGLDFGAIPPISGRGPDRLWYQSGWGFNGIAWLDGELAWSAVGDLDRDSLIAWVKAYRGE